MKKNFIRFFAVIAMVAMWTACNEQESYMQGPDEAMASTITGEASSPVSTGGVTPYIIPGENPGGNRTCAEAADAFGVTGGFLYSSDRVNYESGSFTSTFPSELEVTTDGQKVAWTFTAPAGYCLLNMAVIVKGSAAANVYFYDLSLDPKSTFGDLGLESPVNASGNPAGLSNLTFCYNLVECEDEEKCYDCETAFGGNSVGPVPARGNRAWWFYYDASEGGVQTIWAGQTMNAGTVELVDGKIVISLANGWVLQDTERMKGCVEILDDFGDPIPYYEAVKIQGYSSVPTERPVPGGFAYKGMDLTVSVGEFPYYVIHLDLLKEVECPMP